MAQAAALGLGFGYGTVEELAQAVVWLSERGLDGLGALLEARASSGADLSVALNGPGLLDLLVGEVLAGGEPVERELLAIDSPLLLVGLCGIRSATHRVVFELQADGATGRAVCRTDCGVLAINDAVGLASLVSVRLRASTSNATLSQDTLAGVLDPVDRPTINAERWQAAQALAKTTYVPSNERSRTEGAGAGLTDND